ncbi:11207_t:CDS:2, partial [Rhizophagus irregularis]
MRNSYVSSSTLTHAIDLFSLRTFGFRELEALRGHSFTEEDSYCFVMLPDTLEGYCLTSPYQMAVRNSEVEYLAKANSLLLLFLQQIFRASTTSPVFKVIKMKVEQ